MVRSQELDGTIIDRTARLPKQSGDHVWVTSEIHLLTSCSSQSLRDLLMNCLLLSGFCEVGNQLTLPPEEAPAIAFSFCVSTEKRRKEKR